MPLRADGSMRLVTSPSLVVTEPGRRRLGATPVARVSGWLPMAVTAAVLALPANAQVTTFGADLSQPDNVTFDCSVWPVPGVGLVPTGAQSCTWSSDVIPQNLSQSLIVPAGNGTVTQARVKVGVTTGPMQVVVLQALREPGAAPGTNTVGCCQQVSQGDVFTPPANAITTVPLQLPVRNDVTPDANGIYAFDILGLSILAAGVPIPALDTGIYNPTGPNDLIDFPASQPNASIQPTDSFGFELLMNADWVATSTPGPGPQGGGPPTTSGPPIRFAQPAALVQANNALIDLTCALAGPCPGRVRLQNGPAPGATIVPAAVEPQARMITPATKRSQLITYAAGRFKLAGGQTGTIRARLKPKGRKLIRGPP